MSTVQTSTATDASRTSRSSRAWKVVVGEPSLAPLSIAQAFAAVADAFVAVSLAHSLFFNLSPDASRRQVLIYLVITVVPLALVAPLVGPLVDRFRTRQRLLASICFALRAAFCIALASSLLQLSFYGFTLALLVIGKASGIVRQALVPLLVPDPNDLVSANARLARLGSVVAAIGGAIAALLLLHAEAPWLIRAAAVLFVLAAIAVSRTRPQVSTEPALSDVEYAELHLPTIVVGSIGVMAIRGAVGFFVFTVAFSLRRESEPAWVYGVTVLAYGIGSFVGNVLAPWLRKRFQDAQLIAVAIATPTVPVFIGILGVSRPLLIVVAGLLGLAATLGRAAFDSMLQHRAPIAVRGRAAARYETRFQLVWAVGALIATPITLPAEVSMLVLSLVFVPAVFMYVRASNTAQLFEQRSLDAFGRAEARLVAAEESLAGGAYRLAVIDAAAAVDMARLVEPEIGKHNNCADLELLRLVTLDPASDIDEDAGHRAVGLAQSLLSFAEPPLPQRQQTRRQSE